MMTVLALLFAFTGMASAQSLNWDNTYNNPYVSAGYRNQCTAFAWGRYKAFNGESLRFTDTKGKTAYPNAGLMFDYVTESVATYRDSKPVRGALVVWKQTGTSGHVGTIERLYSDGSADVAEQNWPAGSGHRLIKLSAANLWNRPSTTNGKTSYYSLAGYICPNRVPDIGTLYTMKIGSTLQLDVALLDEDGRKLNVLIAIADGNKVVSGSTVSGSVIPNQTIRVRWNNTAMLQRGKKYTIHLWTTDWRGLRSSKSNTFTW